MPTRFKENRLTNWHGLVGLNHKLSKLRRVRWSMWLSHHPPCDYDHTFRLGVVRVCARCSGIAIGIVLTVASARWWVACPTNGMIAIVLLLPLPAVVDFVRHEGFDRPSGNARRCCTGLMLGLACGILISAWPHGKPLVTFAAIAWLILLEFAVMLTLRGAGKLEGYAARYEEAVFKVTDETGIRPGGV